MCPHCERAIRGSGQSCALVIVKTFALKLRNSSQTNFRTFGLQSFGSPETYMFFCLTNWRRSECMWITCSNYNRVKFQLTSVTLRNTNNSKHDRKECAAMFTSFPPEVYSDRLLLREREWKCVWKNYCMLHLRCLPINKINTEYGLG